MRFNIFAENTPLAHLLQSSDLKRPGETFVKLLEEMIEHEKKLRLFLDMEEIEKKDKFVELPL